MTVVWQDVAVALCSRLEFERRCRRSAVIEESSVKQYTAEVLQAVTQLRIEPEENLQQLPGNSRVDLVGYAPRSGKIELAVEIKLVREQQGVTRYWEREVTKDVLRVEYLSTNMKQGAERAVIVVGSQAAMRNALWDRNVNCRGRQGPTVRWAPLSVQARDRSQFLPQTATNVQVQTPATPEFTTWIRARASEANLTSLPISYRICLAAHYAIDDSDNGTYEAAIWLVSRVNGRGTFAV